MSEGDGAPGRGPGAQRGVNDRRGADDQPGADQPGADHQRGEGDRGPAEGDSSGRPTQEANPARSGSPREEQLLPDRSVDDTDRGWGDEAQESDDHLLRERPPHWD